jgi:PAS domain S-box-containing protein
MDRSLYVNTLTGKRIPLVRLMLAIKSNVTSASSLYVLLAFFKLLGLLILTISFIPSEEASYGYRISKFLRSITTFGILGKSLTYSNYTMACYISILLLIVCLGIFIYTLKQTRIKEDFIVTFKARVLSVVLAVIFQVVMILSQHLLEFFSFIFMIVFNSGVDNSASPFKYLTKEYALFFNATSTTDGFILMVINLFGIILMNVFMYFALRILNEPFFDTDFPIQMKFSGFHMFLYIFFSNLHAIHYVELFVPTLTSVKVAKYIILAIITLLLIFGFVRSYNAFNFYNKLNYFVYFMLTFAFFSTILEVSLNLTDNQVNDFQQMLFILICKLLITSSFVIMTYYINERLFISRLKTSLFQNYDGRINKSDLESIFYLIKLLVNLKHERVDDLSKYMNIILAHKAECGVDYCKCNSISEYKTEKLVDETNLILESIFVNLNLGKDHVINIVFAEYLYYQRKALLFSWSIMNTYIAKNCGIVENFEIYLFFLISLKKTIQYDEQLKSEEQYIHFNLVFREIAIGKFYEKKMIRFMENFENFISFKEKFDNSLKVDHSEGTIDSYIFQTSLSEIVDTCRKHQMLYRKMKGFIRKDFGKVRCKSVELSYKLYAFFLIFNKKSPTNILQMIVMDSTLDVTSATAIQQYFNSIFDKFFSDTKAPMNMIIEINKMFKIKYVNYKLCQALGYSYNKLINDDIHQLFPTQLRESHKKVLLNHFLIQKKLFFRKKTFAFTSSHNMVPLDLMVSSFPTLKKNLQAVVSVYPINDDNKRNFYFVITEFFELIAISDNLDTYYSLNYDVIDTLGINVLKLFDIDGLIPVKFKTQLDNIQTERRLKHLDHLYSLSYFLFNLNGGDDQGPPAQQQGERPPPSTTKKENKDPLLGGLSGKRPDGKMKGTSITAISGLKKMGTSVAGTQVDGLHDSSINGTITPDAMQNNFSKLALNDNETPEGGKAGGPYKNYQHDDQTSDNTRNQLLKNGENGGEHQTPEQHAQSGSLSGKGKDDDMFSVLRDKRSVIQNIDKIKNRCKDMETGVQFYERLTDCVNKLKASTGMTEPSNMFNVNGKDREKIKNKYANKSNNSYSENFEIKISFRKINDAPFFIVGVKEKMVYKAAQKAPKLKLRKELTVVGETPDELARGETSQFGDSPTPQPGPMGLLFKNKLGTEKTTMSKPTQLKKELNARTSTVFELKKGTTTMLAQEKEKKGEEIMKDPNGILPPHKKRKNTVVAAKVSVESQNKQERKQQADKRKELIYTIVLGILLVLNLTIAIVVFEFKLFVLETTKDFFNIAFWSKEHESSLLALHSSVISFMAMLGGYSTYQTKFLKGLGLSVSISDFKNIIEERSQIHRDNFANFYATTKSSGFELTELQNLLYSTPEEYETLLLTWEPVISKETFIFSTDYYCSNARSLSMDTAYDGLLRDLESGFLFKQFDKNRKANLNSKNSKLVYYINFNLLKFEKKLRDFEIAIKNAKTDFNNSWRQLTSVMEIVNIVLSLILIVVIHLTLGRSDTSLFRVLLSMFLNMRKGKKANFKSTYECQLIKMQMKNFKVLLHTFVVDNIRQLDETINIDEYGISKILFRNRLGQDIEVAGLLGGDNASVQVPLSGSVTATPNSNISDVLTGSILGLNSSSTPLGLVNQQEGSLDSAKEKGDEKKEEKKEKPASSKAKKGKSDDKGEVVDTFLNNGQVLKRTKHYSIRFIKFAKVLITIIFLLYIFFIVSNVVTNTTYLADIDSNVELVSSFLMKLPAAARIYNMVRLMILENDVSFVKDYPLYMSYYDTASKDSDILYDQYSTKLPNAFEYYNIMISQDYVKRTEEICSDGYTKEICKASLLKENGYNKEGLKIAATTVIQTLNNIYKDYMKIYESGIPSQVNSLPTRETVSRYLLTEEFANVNIQIEYVFQHSSIGYFKAVYTDISSQFDFIINLDLVLGIASIFLNVIIILYLIFGFFSRLKLSMNYISYSAKKFNKVLFEA